MFHRIARFRWPWASEPIAEETPKPPRSKKTKNTPEPPPLSDKDKATLEGRPYVNVLQMDIDAENPSLGSFELEWNELFIKQLVKAGYRGTTDEQIVDQWFQAVCRNIANEEYEQFIADPENRMINKRDLGGGRYEAS